MAWVEGTELYILWYQQYVEYQKTKRRITDLWNLYLFVRAFFDDFSQAKQVKLPVSNSRFLKLSFDCGINNNGPYWYYLSIADSWTMSEVTTGTPGITYTTDTAPFLWTNSEGWQPWAWRTTGYIIFPKSSILLWLQNLINYQTAYGSKPTDGNYLIDGQGGADLSNLWGWDTIPPGANKEWSTKWFKTIFPAWHSGLGGP